MDVSTLPDFSASFIPIPSIPLSLPVYPLIDGADTTNEGTIPEMTKMPVIAKPNPAVLATQIPFDHIFSPKIIPAKRPIQSKFIHPNATIRRK